MKMRPLLIGALIVLACATLHAQSVVITPKKVTYKRTKPFVDYKKTFTINYPRVKAATPALSKKIEDVISYERVFPYYKLKEELKQSGWADSGEYEVVYNKHGLLCISMTLEGSGAYPSGDTKHITVNSVAGTKVRPADVFSNIQGLLKMVRKAKDNEVAKAKIDLKSENSEIDQVFAGSPALRLDQFSISDQGITFYYDYEFVHAIEALEPRGEFAYTWKQLKPYIKPGGLLARIAR